MSEVKQDLQPATAGFHLFFIVTFAMMILSQEWQQE